MSKLIRRQKCNICSDGTQEYFLEDNHHRDPKFGPARIWLSGTKQYCFKGKLHRDPKDGPAVVWADGELPSGSLYVLYVVNGKRTPEP
jgi:hypothetical protein